MRKFLVVSEYKILLKKRAKRSREGEKGLPILLFLCHDVVLVFLSFSLTSIRAICHKRIALRPIGIRRWRQENKTTNTTVGTRKTRGGMEEEVRKDSLPKPTIM